MKLKQIEAVIWGFAAERDRMYVIFTVIVLAILIFSLVGSSQM